MLRRGGVFICSTPNRSMSRWATENHYHEHEFMAKEFRQAVESVFDDVHLFAQQEMGVLKYAGQRLLSRALHTIGLMKVAKSVCGWKIPQQALRTQYGGVPLDPYYEIHPYRPSVFVQPKYILAVAKKLL